MLVQLVIQTYQISVNLTSYERKNWSRYEYLLDSNSMQFNNPFDHGLKSNWQEVLMADRVVKFAESDDKTV